MKADEFIHILTRIVNTKHGARFLEIVHDLRKVLEDAGIAEEVGPKLEAGKPLRQRSPEDISKKPKLSFPAPPRLPDIDVPSLEMPSVDLAAEPAAEAVVEAAAEGDESLVSPAPVSAGEGAGMGDGEVQAVNEAGRGNGDELVESAEVEGVDATDATGEAVEEPREPAGSTEPPRGFRLVGGRTSRRGRPRKLPRAPAAEEKPTSGDGPPAAEAALDDAVEDSPPAADAPLPEEFIPAGPNRLIRNPDAHPPQPAAEPGPKGPRKESVRSIVLEALQEGDKTMAELEDVVRARKGTVPHLYQQAYLALKRIGAMKNSTGRFTISTRDAVGPAVGEEPAAEERTAAAAAPTQLNLLDGLSESGPSSGQGEAAEGIGNGDRE